MNHPLPQWTVFTGNDPVDLVQFLETEIRPRLVKVTLLGLMTKVKESGILHILTETRGGELTYVMLTAGQNGLFMVLERDEQADGILGAWLAGKRMDPDTILDLATVKAIFLNYCAYLEAR